MEPILLPVTHIYQHKKGECVAACCAMLLDYLSISTSYKQLLKLLGTQPFGTLASQINKLETLNLTVIYKHGTFTELYEHLTNNRPCIAFVMTGQLPYWHEDQSHAVVVVGLDDERIFLNDPAFPIAPTPVARGDFDLAWFEWDEMYATLMRKT